MNSWLSLLVITLFLSLSISPLLVLIYQRLNRSAGNPNERPTFSLRAIFFVVTLAAAACGIMRLPFPGALKFWLLWMVAIFAFGWLERVRRPCRYPLASRHVAANRLDPRLPPVD
jgi:hypothetical protein